MADTDFYNINKYIAYPFTSVLTLVDCTAPDRDINNELLLQNYNPAPITGIVDLGIVWDIDGQYISGVHKTYLYSVFRSDTDSIYFDFRHTGFTGVKYRILFEFNPNMLDNNPFVIVRAKASKVPPVDCVVSQAYTDWGTEAGKEDTVGYGYLVFSDMTDWYNFINSDSVYYNDVFIPVLAGVEPEDNFIVEPTCVYSVLDSQIKKIRIANYPLTRYTNVDCNVTNPFNSFPVEVTNLASGFTGDVTLQAGYNCEISLDKVTNTVSISSSLGAGAGAVCTEVLDNLSNIPIGGITCNEGIFSINNITPISGNINIIGTNGILVQNDPANNQIIIFADLADRVDCSPR